MRKFTASACCTANIDTTINKLALYEAQNTSLSLFIATENEGLIRVEVADMKY